MFSNQNGAIVLESFLLSKLLGHPHTAIGLALVQSLALVVGAVAEWTKALHLIAKIKKIL